jgi:RNA polymerase sigma-70 factor (ECF subfamily)
VEGKSQDERYLETAAEYGAALHRLASAYESDPDKRRDLLQDIHLALWRSLASFDGRCSLRTWVYRVAHNAATSYVIGQRRSHSSAWLSLEDVAPVADPAEGERAADQRLVVERLLAFIQQLRPLDRQVILSYLEGLDAVATAEITGISPGNVATKIHRIKTLLSQQFQEGVRHAER